MENIENTKDFQRLYEKLKEENKIEDISNNQQKSFILTEEKNEIKGYISGIGANTIRKRKIV